MGGQAPWKGKYMGVPHHTPWAHGDTTAMEGKGRMAVPHNKFEESNAQTVVRDHF